VYLAIQLFSCKHANKVELSWVDDVGERDKSDQRWKASVASRLKRDEATQIWRFDDSGCEDFVSEWEEFIFDAFSYFKPVKEA